jgi:3-hydroxyacyl-CoA dehydrogenase
MNTMILTRRVLHHGKSVTTRSFATASSFDKIGIVGLGLMGHGIAQVAAQSGVHTSVVAFEPEQKYLDKGKERIESSIQKLVKKEKLTADQAERILSTIHFTTDMSALCNADFVVEAVIENMDLKRDLYGALGAQCDAKTIFASNTSSLSIAEMAAFSGRPENFCGVHFFNPVQLMKLVEVIKTNETKPEVFEAAYKWVGDIGKVAVRCGDTPGFIVNRLLVPALMQAMCMVDRQDASVADIDLSLQLGAGHPMGPVSYCSCC